MEYKFKKRLYEMFQKCRTTKQQLEFLKAYQKRGLVLMLDNDDSYAIFEDDIGNYEDDMVILQLNDYLGWTDGVAALLEVAGIKYEFV